MWLSYWRHSNGSFDDVVSECEERHQVGFCLQLNIWNGVRTTCGTHQSINRHENSPKRRWESESTTVIPFADGTWVWFINSLDAVIFHRNGGSHATLEIAFDPQQQTKLNIAPPDEALIRSVSSFLRKTFFNINDRLTFSFSGEC